ncbi:hypothetical protein C8Q70DRAFT_936607 [Cubamyces menziesii]|nr:hypothetical protein C8Q70DRAFT_936607 [Cubamyces menziesii]
MALSPQVWEEGVNLCMDVTPLQTLSAAASLAILVSDTLHHLSGDNVLRRKPGYNWCTHAIRCTFLLLAATLMSIIWHTVVSSPTQVLPARWEIEQRVKDVHQECYMQKGKHTTPRAKTVEKDEGSDAEATGSQLLAHQKSPHTIMQLSYGMLNIVDAAPVKLHFGKCNNRPIHSPACQ